MTNSPLTVREFLLLLSFSWNIYKMSKTCEEWFLNKPHTEVSPKSDKEKKELDHLLRCPITHDLFEDPVIDPNGNSYSRAAILKWLRSGNTTSPITRKPLTEADLRTNRGLCEIVAKHKKNGSTPSNQTPIGLLAESKYWFYRSIEGYFKPKSFEKDNKLEARNPVFPDGSPARHTNGDQYCTVISKEGDINGLTAIDSKDSPPFSIHEFTTSTFIHITGASDHTNCPIRVSMYYSLCNDLPLMNLSFRVWFKKDGGEWCPIKTGMDCSFPKPHTVIFETSEVNGRFVVTFDRWMLPRLYFKCLPGILFLNWMVWHHF